MDIQEIILCKYGEIVLKGANRQNFESALVKELRRRASPYGTFKIYFKQSTLYVEPQTDDADMEGMYSAARKVFGIVGVNRAAVCEKNMESIIATAREYLPAKLSGIRILSPGFSRISLKPELYGLQNAFIRIPTRYGAIEIEMKTGEYPRITVPNGIIVE